MKTDQKEIDEEKIRIIATLTKNLIISRPAILLHEGDDWCWLQYYALRFVGRDAYVFIKEEDKGKIQLQDLPKNIEAVYYKNQEELDKLTENKIEEYTKILDKCYGDVNE